MRSFIRFVNISRILVRYRLDNLVLSTPLLKSFRPLVYLTPWHYFPSSKFSRGERIRLALEELGPVYIKFGQTLSTRRDLLPDDIGDELAKLQDKCPPFPAKDSKSIIEKTLEKALKIFFLLLMTHRLLQLQSPRFIALSLLVVRKLLSRLLGPVFGKK